MNKQDFEEFCRIYTIYIVMYRIGGITVGKADRKLKKNKQKKMTEERNIAMNDELVAIEKLIEEEKYTDALNEMPKLAEMNCKNPRFLYNAAYCYFMIGDYERATNWLSSTLSADAANAKARILLARICLLEDRTNDALAIFDFVLGSFAGLLSADDKEEIEEILDYYVTSEEDMLKEEYPNIADFFGIDKDDNAAEEIPQRKVETTMKAPEIEQDAQKIIDEVMGKDVSLAEKVRILNSFAGAFYMSLQYEKSQALLDAAVKIDTQNEYTVRNMAYLLLAMGKSDEAMQWAAKLPMADFALLYTMQCNG